MGRAHDFLDLIDDHVSGVDGEVAVNAGEGDRIMLDGIDLANLRTELFFL